MEASLQDIQKPGESPRRGKSMENLLRRLDKAVECWSPPTARWVLDQLFELAREVERLREALENRCGEGLDTGQRSCAVQRTGGD